MDPFRVLTVVSGFVIIAMAFVFQARPATRLYYVVGGLAFIASAFVLPDFGTKGRIAAVAIPVLAVGYLAVSAWEKRAAVRPNSASGTPGGSRPRDTDDPNDW